MITIQKRTRFLIKKYMAAPFFDSFVTIIAILPRKFG